MTVTEKILPTILLIISLLLPPPRGLRRTGTANTKSIHSHIRCALIYLVDNTGATRAAVLHPAEKRWWNNAWDSDDDSWEIRSYAAAGKSSWPDQYRASSLISVGFWDAVELWQPHPGSALYKTKSGGRGILTRIGNPATRRKVGCK